MSNASKYTKRYFQLKGQEGGQKTLKKYGKSYMSLIGKKGRKKQLSTRISENKANSV